MLGDVLPNPVKKLLSPVVVPNGPNPLVALVDPPVVVPNGPNPLVALVVPVPNPLVVVPVPNPPVDPNPLVVVFPNENPLDVVPPVVVVFPNENPVEWNPPELPVLFIAPKETDDPGDVKLNVPPGEEVELLGAPKAPDDADVCPPKVTDDVDGCPPKEKPPCCF